MESMRRLAMAIVREVLKWGTVKQRTLSEASEITGASRSTCHEIVMRATAAGVSWPLPEGIDDEGLRGMLYPQNRRGPKGRKEPDLAAIWATLTGSRSSRASQSN